MMWKPQCQTGIWKKDEGCFQTRCDSVGEMSVPITPPRITPFKIVTQKHVRVSD